MFIKLNNDKLINVDNVDFMAICDSGCNSSMISIFMRSGHRINSQPFKGDSAETELNKICEAVEQEKPIYYLR